MRLKDAKIGFFGDCFRVLQTLFMGMTIFRGFRLAPPPAKSTRAIALGIQPFRLDTFDAAITAHPQLIIT